MKKLHTLAGEEKKITPFLNGLIGFLLIISLFIPTKIVNAAAPVFSPNPPNWTAMAQMTVGTAWSYDFNTTTGDTGVTYSIFSGSIPGLSINPATGVYSGTPSATGTYAITVRATNADGSTSVSNTFIVKSPTTTQITEVSTAYPEGGYAINYPVWVVIQLNPAAGIAYPANAQVTVTADNGGPTCTATLDENGLGECGLTFVSSNTYTITASYAGSTYYLSSQEDEVITVGSPDLSEVLLAGRYHSCLMDTAGQVNCWGNAEAFSSYDEFGAITSSISDKTYVQFSAGGYHSCGLKADGSIECWGDSTEINTLVPNTVNGKVVHYIRINSGDDHVCAIDSKFRLHCWGEMTAALSAYPNGQFTAVDAGVKHDCAIQKNNDEVVCWGENDARIVVPSGLGSVKQVSVGNTHTCVIKSDDHVDCWGSAFPDPTGMLSYLSIDSGSNFSCGITTGNVLSCWGTNEIINATPTGGTYSVLGSGLQHVCTVSSGGVEPYLDCWGNNDYDQAPKLSFTPVTLPNYLPNGSTWSTIFNGNGGSEPYLLTSSGVLPSGTSLTGMTLSGTLNDIGSYHFDLVLSETFPNIADLPIELKPTTNGYLIQVEDPATSIVINSRTETADVGTPVVVNVTVSKMGTPDFEGFVTISGNETDAVCQAAVGPSGEAECSLYFGTAGDKTINARYDGDDFYDPTVDDATTTTRINPIVINPMITAGSQFNCSIDGNGDVFCWGKNDSNQLIAVNNVFTQISAGVSHGCGVAANSKIYCWGWNGYGVSTPPTTYGFRQVASGETHTCGLSFSGSVTCWGNSANNRLNPPSSLFSQIDAGANHTCAIRSDNHRVNCWGDNSFGQLNIGGYSASTFNQISSGEKAACGVLLNGALACWGTLPAPPAGSYQSVSVGTDHACAINSNQEIVCWGDNNDNKITAPGGSFNSVAAGLDHSCALRSDGFMKCWGNNTKDQAPRLSILPEEFPVLNVNQTWNGMFSVSGARSANLSYSIFNGILPSGLSLDSGSGQLTGTLSEGNDFTYTVRVFEQDLIPALIQEKTYTQRVKGDTNIQVTEVNPLNPVVGQATWINVTVNEADNSGFGTIPTGDVSVYLDGALRCEEILIDGTATCLVFFGTSGNKSVEVNYAGDEKYLASTNLGAETEFSVSPFEQAIQLKSGDLQTYIHRPDGTLTCIGDGCDLEVFNETYPVFDSGGSLSCGLQTDGQITCLSGETESLYPGPFQNLAVGEDHACAIDLDGGLDCWGDNSQGQAVPPIGVYTKIFTGENASCAIKNNQTLDCWGDPAVVPPPAGTYLDVSIGNGFACGLLSDGSITCWGNDVQGQLTAPSGTNFQQIVSGSHHTCALDENGLVTCWGEINDAPVTSAYGVFIESAAYQDHVCALRANNEITCWGEDDAGEAPQIVVIHLDDIEIPALTYWEHFFEQSNGVKPYIGTVSYGSLPIGLGINSDLEFGPSGLVLYGKPTVPGRYDFALHWIDSGDPQLVLEELHRITVTGADLKIEIQPAHDTTALFDNAFWFDYELSNQTALNVPDVLVTVSLPDGFENITYTGLSGCTIVDQQLTCLISEFVAGSSLTLRVNGDVTNPISDDVSTWATISPTLEKWPEINLSDNTDQKSVTVQYKATVLDEDFTTSQSPNWLSGGLITAPSGETYLGNFSNAQELRLVIDDLAPHSKVIVQFKLYVIGGWQGNGTILSTLPALYQFGQTGETALTTTTFCNGDCTQAYPGQYPSGVYPAQTRALETNLLEFPATSDAYYEFEYRFNHNTATLDLTWLSENLPTNARFGIDEVKITLDSGWEFVYLPLIIK